MFFHCTMTRVSCWNGTSFLFWLIKGFLVSAWLSCSLPSQYLCTDSISPCRSSLPHSLFICFWSYSYPYNQFKPNVFSFLSFFFLSYLISSFNPTFLSNSLKFPHYDIKKKLKANFLFWLLLLFSFSRSLNFFLSFFLNFYKCISHFVSLFQSVLPFKK